MKPALGLMVAASSFIPWSLTPVVEYGGNTNSDGATVTETSSSNGSSPGGSSQGAGSDNVVAGPAVEYKIIINCSGNSIDNPDETLSCASAVTACQDSTEGKGPQSLIYSRPAGTTAWTYLLTTCLPDQFATKNAQRLTLADIQREFNNTPFTTPTGTTQPAGNATLVNLPAYFALTWPTTGYRPGHTKTFTLLGHTITLRLNHGGHTYTFGDGTTTGPTTSPGGPYPTGDITHTYTTPGTYHPSAATTITADFQIDGGPWQPLPGNATRTTTYPPLDVLTATNHLIPDPR